MCLTTDSYWANINILPLNATRWLVPLAKPFSYFMRDMRHASSKYT